MGYHNLEKLLTKYETATDREDVFIKRMLEDTVEILGECEEKELYYADLIARNLSRVIEVMEKKQEKTHQATDDRQKEPCRFQSGEHLLRDFYNYYKKEDQVDYLEIGYAIEANRRDRVNLTMRDYAARIKTFAGKKYLGEMVSLQQLGNTDPILYTYENIEKILATFKTRNEAGQINKQRVNIRSALRKLNEFKQKQQ